MSEMISVVCSASAAYTSLYRGLKYLLKVPIIIERGRIFDFRDSVFGQVENIVLCLKINIKK